VEIKRFCTKFDAKMMERFCKKFDAKMNRRPGNKMVCESKYSTNLSETLHLPPPPKNVSGLVLKCH
jgi:hypothetical protein